PKAIASCLVDGKKLWLRVTDVTDNGTVDNPIPLSETNGKDRVRGMTVRKLLEKLRDEPKEPLKFKGNNADAARIGLRMLNRFHYHFSKVANEPLLCLCYRGPLGEHLTCGHRGFILPMTSNPSLTWSITSLEFNDKQHLVCQITVSLTKQPDTVMTYA